MVGDCDVLVATSCLDGKSACVVGVELGEQHFCEIQSWLERGKVGLMIGSPIGAGGGGSVDSESMTN